MQEYNEVTKPFHYNQYGVEVVDITSLLPNNAGNIVKYLMRSPYKGCERKDLGKSSQYWQFLMGQDLGKYFRYAYTPEGTQHIRELVTKAFEGKTEPKDLALKDLVSFVVEATITLQDYLGRWQVDPTEFTLRLSNYMDTHVSNISENTEHRCCGGRCKCKKNHVE